MARVRLLIGAAVALLLIACQVLPDGTVVSKRIDGDPWLKWNDPDDGLNDAPVDLEDHGYVEEEFFLSGDATSYAQVGTWGPDGRWTAEPKETAHFGTRVLVRRPADRRAFNGVVYVEWLNTTLGHDLDVHFRQTHTEMLRSGYAWVGVTAQKQGVDALRARDPDRYGGLVHPGDAYNFDIFTRAGRAAANPRSRILGGLQPEVVLAEGGSQSGAWLHTYVNAVHPLVGVYDGFWLAAVVGSAPVPGATMPDRPILRTDLDVPVLQTQTETELVVFRRHLVSQPDTDRYRMWEIAGSAHAGEYHMVWPTLPLPTQMGCIHRLNTSPTFVVYNGALDALARWARGEGAPPSAPRLELTDPTVGDPIARDAFGNAIGGIRLPEVDVPRARVDGVANAPLPGQPPFGCILGGRTIPLSEEELATLYPSAEDYLSRFDAAVQAQVANGFILDADGVMLSTAERQSLPPVP